MAELWSIELKFDTGQKYISFQDSELAKFLDERARHQEPVEVGIELASLAAAVEAQRAETGVPDFGPGTHDMLLIQLGGLELEMTLDELRQALEEMKGLNIFDSANFGTMLTPE